MLHFAADRDSGGGGENGCKDQGSEGFLGRADVHRLRRVLHDLGAHALPDGDRGAHGPGILPGRAGRADAVPRPPGADRIVRDGGAAAHAALQHRPSDRRGARLRRAGLDLQAGRDRRRLCNSHRHGGARCAQRDVPPRHEAARADLGSVRDLWLHDEAAWANPRHGTAGSSSRPGSAATMQFSSARWRSSCSA